MFSRKVIYSPSDEIYQLSMINRIVLVLAATLSLFSPDSLKILIPSKFCHFVASKWSPSWPNFGKSWGHVGLQNAGFSWGLALGAHKPAKISQHKVNFSLYRPIVACGLGGDREALNQSEWTMLIQGKLPDSE